MSDTNAPGADGNDGHSGAASLRTTNTPALLALYGSIVEELLRRNVVRSTNNPVADYAEYLAARAFGLTLVANSSVGYDGIDGAGVRYQVKARRWTTRNKSRQLGFLRGFATSENPFDLLLAILFEPDFAVRRAALVPVALVRSRAVRVEYVNAWRLILSDVIWTLENVIDVTDRVRAAATIEPNTPG